MPVKNDREYRNLTEFRAVDFDDDQKQRIVEGYASTFDEPYTLFSGPDLVYEEVVDRGAFDNTDMSDVIFQYDHAGRVFARNRNNTLEIGVDDRGLLIKADLGGTEIGRELYEEIRGGYTDKMSFGFTVDGETEERIEREGDPLLIRRHITSVKKLYDVSAVSIPANNATEISVRNLTDGVIEKMQAERLEREQMELRRRKLMLKLKMEGQK